MTHDTKVRRAAELLIERDGPDAVRVALSGANACAFFGNHEGASVWMVVAETVAALMDDASEPRLIVEVGAKLHDKQTARIASRQPATPPHGHPRRATRGDLRSPLAPDPTEICRL